MTFLMVSVVSGQAGLFLIIVGALYAGEVDRWRESGTCGFGANSTIPCRRGDWADFVSKVSGAGGGGKRCWCPSCGSAE